MTMNAGKLNKMGSTTDSIMNRTNNYVIGKSVLLTLSPNNEITNVTGFEEILNNQGADSAGREMIKKMFSKDQFNNMFGMMFSMYPKKTGKSW